MIELKNITKSYKTKGIRHYVFKNLSFTIPHNTNVGILGRNGQGKSTLMRMIGGIDPPDSGEISTQKSISWPVGLAGGFQGQLTAKDNIRFVCRVYGCSEKQIEEKTKYVRDFAEIGNHFDLPMKTYSSGMKSRVSFGLSMAFDFDYYLVDEVLAVGDAHFRSKSQKVFKAKSSNANIIMVSHSTNTLKEMCDSLILINNGNLTFYQDIQEGLKVYADTNK
ncbi:MAG: ABC transporter ATP-binding protein [Candidatus Caenarcaniphilales bacterium]|nr:ABC transporter ATP-binding protein [Candidatus Caenarcaniphilales bacterium]